MNEISGETNNTTNSLDPRTLLQKHLRIPNSGHHFYKFCFSQHRNGCPQRPPLYHQLLVFIIQSILTDRFVYSVDTRPLVPLSPFNRRLRVFYEFNDSFESDGSSDLLDSYPLANNPLALDNIQYDIRTDNTPIDRSVRREANPRHTEEGEAGFQVERLFPFLNNFYGVLQVICYQLFSWVRGIKQSEYNKLFLNQIIMLAMMF